MMQSDLGFLGNVLRLLAMQAPVLIAAIVGCVLVGNRWRALGSAAVPALLGLLLFIFLDIAGPIIYAAILTAHSNAALLVSWSTIIGIVQSLLSATALGLLILGIILHRNAPPPSGF